MYCITDSIVYYVLYSAYNNSPVLSARDEYVTSQGVLSIEQVHSPSNELHELTPTYIPEFAFIYYCHCFALLRHVFCTSQQIR